MSAPSLPATNAIASQLGQALQRYQYDFDEMVESHMDTPYYRAVTAEIHDISVMKRALPQLSNEVAEVLMRHVELVHSVWNSQIRPSAEADQEMKRLRQRHRAAVEALGRKCQELFSQQQ
jgi:predicted ATPase